MGVRFYPDLPRVYLDMDGPLADFDLYCQLKGLNPKEAKRYSGTYLSLPPTVDAIDAVEFLISKRNLDLFVLSKIPSENPGAATEKHFWLERHLPALASRLILSPDKGCVGSKRDFLVDDHPEWANADKFPGEIITFKTISNKSGHTWTQILEYFATRLQPH